MPIKTFADWDGARPGFLEIDLVPHCRSTAAGQFSFTLTTVDVATGWTLCRGVRNKGEEAVFNELAEIRRRLPFPLLGLDYARIWSLCELAGLDRTAFAAGPDELRSISNVLLVAVCCTILNMRRHPAPRSEHHV